MVQAMDARTAKHQGPEHGSEEQPQLLEGDTTKRDRLLASLTLTAGVGLIIALPFALRAGAEFFLPVTAALVIAIALVPMLEWFERRGVPSRIAAALCVVIFLAVAIFVIASIVLPATDWVALVPQRIGKVRHALEPIFDLYKNFDRFIGKIAQQVTFAPQTSRTVRIETPNSALGLITASVCITLLTRYRVQLLA